MDARGEKSAALGQNTAATRQARDLEAQRTNARPSAEAIGVLGHNKRHRKILAKPAARWRDHSRLIALVSRSEWQLLPKMRTVSWNRQLTEFDRT
jgi:hypothetical protein